MRTVAKGLRFPVRDKGSTIKYDHNPSPPAIRSLTTLDGEIIHNYNYKS